LNQLSEAGYENLDRPGVAQSRTTSERRELIVIASRVDDIPRAVPKLYRDKWAAIVPLCEGRRVLDVGCVGDYDALEDLRLGSHVHLRTVADVVGIDISQAGAAFLNSLGCDCRILNATRIADLLPEQFEVVLLGDILEHMPDPACFLSQVSRVLAQRGVRSVHHSQCTSLPEHGLHAAGPAGDPWSTHDVVLLPNT
jgi:SAM-dependent methyltransferase